jgi:hypothetical protein
VETNSGYSVDLTAPKTIDPTGLTAPSAARAASPHALTLAGLESSLNGGSAQARFGTSAAGCNAADMTRRSMSGFGIGCLGREEKFKVATIGALRRFPAQPHRKRAINGT